jgi:hypothetical protein
VAAEAAVEEAAVVVVVAAVEAAQVAAVVEAVCMWASAVQEPDPCDPTPTSLAMKDILNPCVQAVVEAAAEAADPEELYS